MSAKKNNYIPIKAKATPIYQTSVFTFDDLNELESYFEQPGQSYMYSRMANPNNDELAEEVAAMEKGEGAVVTSSGMSAILTAILTFCRSGDHVLCAEEIYGGSSTLLSTELRRLGIEVSFVPMDSIYSLDAFTRDNTQLLLTETFTNPLLKVQDIAKLAQECKRVGIKLVIDNTFTTPYITRPLELGADMVIHSVTKYISGHSDVTAGIVVTNGAHLTRARQVMIIYGLNLSPFESWLAARGLKTLHLRMEQHSKNALALATYLEQHPKVEKVFYPGLESHPDHALAKEQGNNLYGGMLSFKIKDDLEAVNQFMRGLEQIPFAPSLAGVATSISHPLKTSHRSLTKEQQAKVGITMGLIRLSVGIEPVESIEEQLEKALALI